MRIASLSLSAALILAAAFYVAINSRPEHRFALCQPVGKTQCAEAEKGF